MSRRIPRRLARLPIPLYHWGFGPLLGHRLMMLEHRGRTTGQRRYVVLEVLDRGPGWLLLASGYGASSHWYRNVVATPEVRVWTGRLKNVPARGVPVPLTETAQLLTTYREQHRRAAKALGRTLAIPDLVSDGPIPADIGSRLPLLRIEFTDDV